jgi:hypothetical protein
MSLNDILDKNLANARVTLSSLLEIRDGLGYQKAPTMIHGSVLSERFDTDSDIDLLICAQGVKAMHVLTYVGTQRIDVAVLGPERLLEAIADDAERGHDDLAYTLLNGTPIDGCWDALIEFAENRLHEPPTFNAARTSNKMIGTIQELRSGRRSRFEQLGQAYRIVEFIAAAILQKDGQWATSGPVLLRRLESHDSAAAFALHDAFHEFLRTGDSCGFSAICTDRLKLEMDRHQPLIISI